jgi:CheY-like chemotaxis protein
VLLFPNNGVCSSGWGKLGMKKILVIEDNEQNFYLITLLLEHHGYEVLTANDGIREIQSDSREVPNLILLDNQLPIMKPINSDIFQSEVADYPVVGTTPEEYP